MCESVRERERKTDGARINSLHSKQRKIRRVDVDVRLCGNADKEKYGW